MSLLYRLWYGFECVNAYLAGMMGEDDVMHNHLAMADRAWLKWWKEQK
jgi:hypothetical protein